MLGCSKDNPRLVRQLVASSRSSFWKYPPEVAILTIRPGTFDGPLPCIYQPLVAQHASARIGRVARVGRPAGFRLKRPLKWLVCGNDDRQLLAGYGSRYYIRIGDRGKICQTQGRPLCGNISADGSRPQAVGS
jgi:hypothetical protein